MDQLKISNDINECKAHIKGLKAEFNQRVQPADEKERVKELLAHLVEMDQYIRICALERSPNFLSEEFEKNEEERAFFEKLTPIWEKIDNECTKKLKELLKSREWFAISEFGEQADRNAWLLVQHADMDPAFQKRILTVLEKLYPLGETQPRHYAYLYDRVAMSYFDPDKRGLQRYATQGMDFVEDPKNLNKRRKKLGLDPIKKN